MGTFKYLMTLQWKGIAQTVRVLSYEGGRFGQIVIKLIVAEKA